MQPQVAAVNLLTAVTARRAKVPEFRAELAKPLANASLVALALRFYEEVTDVLQQTLRLSVVSVSLKNRIALTGNASTLAITVDLINQSLKAKCPANPAWSEECERALDEVTIDLTSVKNCAMGVQTIAEEEEA
jgi:hypothetical protein